MYMSRRAQVGLESVTRASLAQLNSSFRAARAPIDYIMRRDLTARRGGGAGSWPSTSECDAFITHGQARPQKLSSELMLAWAALNQTLVSTLYTTAHDPNDLRFGWSALTAGCRVVPHGCWCFHVPGSMVKADNPKGARQCAPKDHIMDCTDPASGPFYVKARRVC